MPTPVDLDAMSLSDLKHLLNVLNTAIEDHEKCPECTAPPMLIFQRDKVEALYNERSKHDV